MSLKLIPLSQRLSSSTKIIIIINIGLLNNTVDNFHAISSSIFLNINYCRHQHQPVETTLYHPKHLSFSTSTSGLNITGQILNYPTSAFFNITIINIIRINIKYYNSSTTLSSTSFSTLTIIIIIIYTNITQDNFHTLSTSSILIMSSSSSPVTFPIQDSTKTTQDNTPQH